MKFIPGRISGVCFIELEPRIDERGFFARTFCTDEFGNYGLNVRWPQTNLTRTLSCGTIRGLHWQSEPKPEIKLVRCSIGRIWDVVVDIRLNSPTFGQWESFELTAEGHHQLYIGIGLAHGFQCLEDGSEVSYMMSECYFPELAKGLRWNDPEVAIRWPLGNPMISSRDRQLPLLSEIH